MAPADNDLDPASAIAARAREQASRPDATVRRGINTAVMLLSLGFVDEAGELLAELARFPPAGQNALLDLWHRIRAGKSLKNENGMAGASGKNSDIMIAPGPNARRIIVVFAWGPGRYQEVNNLVLMRRTDASLIWLRNRNKANYLGGVSGVGANYADCISGFHDIFARLHAGGTRPDIYCIGHSASGYPALRFALDLGARAVLCTSPFTTLSAQDMPAGTKNMAEATDAPRELTMSVRPLYLAAERRPRVTICYGGENREDCWMADQLRDVPGVTLLPLAGVADHNSLIELARGDRFGQLIEAMLSD